ncbi:MAG: glycosyltransferase family 39 protein [Actinomycetota bacterium]|nr:glycosyltransferase family 39 protein [Actinomycetota bacterium]
MGSGTSFAAGRRRFAAGRRSFAATVRGHATIGTLIFVALVARVGYVLDTWKFIPHNDPQVYDWLGKGLANGHGWVMGSSAYRPPAYPFYLAFIYKVIGVPQASYNLVTTRFGGWTGVRLVEALVAVVTVLLLAWLAEQLAGRTVALVALAVGAVYLPLIMVGVSLMTESLLVPLVLGAVNFAVRARTAERPTRWILLAGLFSGLAALTRGNGIVVGIGLAFLVWTGRPIWARRSLARPLLLLAVTAVTIMPWTIRNAIAQHQFVPVTTELGATLTGTYNHVAAKHHYQWEAGHRFNDYRAIRRNKELTEAQRSDQLVSAVFGYIGKHPTAVPATMFWNTVRLFDLQNRFTSRQSAHTDVYASKNAADLGVYSFWLVGLLAIAGLFTKAARKIPRVLWVIPFLLWLSEAPITTGTPRFRAVLDPFFILLAGCALVSLARRAARLPISRRGSSARHLGSTESQDPAHA